MTPLKGQKVQVRFNNGVFFDATVEDWSDQKSVLVLPDTGDKVIIQKTLQDVMLVKILNSPKPSKVEIEEPNEIHEEFEALKEQPKNENNLKRMSELKDALNKLEREEVLKKATSFTASGVRQVTYGIPRTLQVSSTAQHTAEEIATTDSDVNSELQNLFG
jgi:rRNA-processing protein FCF1